MKTTFKLSKLVRGVMVLVWLSLIYAVIVPFIVLIFSFAKLDACDSVKKSIGLIGWAGSVLVLTAAILVYRIFKQVELTNTWLPGYSKTFTIVITLILMGFCLTNLQQEMMHTISVRGYENASCPPFWSIMQDGNMFINFFIRMILEPSTWVMLLCIAFLRSFLEYSYSIKKENESFI